MLFNRRTVDVDSTYLHSTASYEFQPNGLRSRWYAKGTSSAIRIKNTMIRNVRELLDIFKASRHILRINVEYLLSLPR